jgi:hypothetical protein
LAGAVGAWVGLAGWQKADISAEPDLMILQTGIFAKSARLNSSTLKNS